MKEPQSLADVVLAELSASAGSRPGFFQLLSYVLAALAAVQVGLLHTTYVFLAADLPHRCMIPECEAPGDAYSPAWLPAALPDHPRDARCYRRAPRTPLTPLTAHTAEDDPGHSSCSTANFSSELVSCDRWKYETNNTIVAEFGLACEDWKRTLVGTVHNVGMLVSLPVFGYISDRWGRKPALVLSCTLVGVVGTMKAFSVSYEMYVLVEFVETLFGASAFPAAYVLTVELVGAGRRALVTLFLGSMLVVGGLLLAALSWALPYWRTFVLVVYPPSVLFALYTALPLESLRWLIARGRRDEAVRLAERAAALNGVRLSDDTLARLASVTVSSGEQQGGGGAQAVLDTLRSPRLALRALCVSWWWVSCTFVFYGLAVSSVSLGGEPHADYALAVSVELIAVGLNAVLLDRAGRRRTLLAAFLVSGAALGGRGLVGQGRAGTALFLLGKVGITQAFSGVYMYTSELFPTRARHSLLAGCSMIGRLGSIAAPQVPLLALYVEWLPAALFSGAALLSAMLMLTTPETLGAALPDTVHDAEMLGRTTVGPAVLEMTAPDDTKT